MKKYFISFVYTNKEFVNGFANCVKSSIDNNISLELLRRWENEIKESSKGVERVDILFFKEVK